MHGTNLPPEPRLHITARDMDSETSRFGTLEPLPHAPQPLRFHSHRHHVASAMGFVGVGDQRGGCPRGI